MGNNRIGAINLGDKRRTLRLCEFLDKASQNYQASIAQLAQNKHTSKAYYRLIENEHLDRNTVLEEHVKSVQQRVKAYQTVLCIQDTTELDYTSKPATQGLGRLNYDARHGMYVHPTLMLSTDGIPLGITDLWTWARKPKGEEDIKESLRWKEGFERICELAEDNPTTRYVYIADREADTQDIIQLAETKQHVADYLIRAKHSRILQNGSKLFDITQERNELGRIEFTIGRGRGKASRSVIQNIYSQRVQLKIGNWVTIIIAKEINPPPGSTAVVWRLLSNRSVENLDQASELIDWYRKRWQIETLFNIFKTGCKIEDRQFNSIEKLEKLSLLYLLISYRILLITMLSKAEAKGSCEVLFDQDEWKIAYKIKYRKSPPKQPISLKEMVNIVAGFGGHLGRKNDGDPGAKTIWQGLLLLHSYVFAANIISHIK